MPREPWHRFLVQASMLRPIHVTSIRNGRMFGHNCYEDTDCSLKDEHNFGPVDGIEIGKRYMFDPTVFPVHETWEQPSQECRMTILEDNFKSKVRGLHAAQDLRCCGRKPR